MKVVFRNPMAESRLKVFVNGLVECCKIRKLRRTTRKRLIFVERTAWKIDSGNLDKLRAGSSASWRQKHQQPVWAIRTSWHNWNKTETLQSWVQTQKFVSLKLINDEIVLFLFQFCSLLQLCIQTVLVSCIPLHIYFAVTGRENLLESWLDVVVSSWGTLMNVIGCRRHCLFLAHMQLCWTKVMESVGVEPGGGG